MAEKASLSAAPEMNPNAQSMHTRGRNQDAEGKIAGQGIFKMKFVDAVADSVCKVSYERREIVVTEGTGFLGRIKTGDYESYWLVHQQPCL